MASFFIAVISGLTVLALASWFGIGKDKNSKVLPSGFKVRKTGKWIIIISVIMVVCGLALWLGDPGQNTGFNLHSQRASFGFLMAILGGILFGVGKIIEWFQKI